MTTTETNLGKQYIDTLHAHFAERAPLAYQVLAAKGQEFPYRARYQPVLGKMGQCYENAFYLAESQGLHYVEGMAISSPDLLLPLDHAWCVDDNGFVYDPTWAEGGHYFGMAFHGDAVRRFQRETGYHCVLGNLYRLHQYGVEGLRQLLFAAAVPINILEDIHADH